jgi:hypothetical protein
MLARKNPMDSMDKHNKVLNTSAEMVQQHLEQLFSIQDYSNDQDQRFVKSIKREYNSRQAEDAHAEGKIPSTTL